MRTDTGNVAIDYSTFTSNYMKWGKQSKLTFCKIAIYECCVFLFMTFW